MRLLHLGTVFTCALLCACQCGERAAAVYPHIEATPAALDFGQTPVATALVREVTIQNRSATPLTVIALGLQGDAAQFAFEPLATTTVAGAASVVVRVRYAPTAVGSHAARLVVQSDASNAPELLVPLAGTATAACDVARCDQPPGPCARELGLCVDGACVYPPKDDGARCDDGDGCTIDDVCHAGGCAGTAKACSTPPPASCVDAQTQRTWASSGACAAGVCGYAPSDTPCAAPLHATASCTGAACDFTCHTGYHRCGARCVPDTDVDSCGASCAPCASGPTDSTRTCDGVSCGWSCAAGFHACGTACCPDAPVYLKASNTDPGDGFARVALSADGNTLVVGAPDEQSAATTINGNQADDSLRGAGAAYVFVRANGAWTQQAYLKASAGWVDGRFGYALALSADGDTVAIGALGERVPPAGANTGATYVFTRSGTTWTQQARVVASNGDASDMFGAAVALSADGAFLAVGAPGEASNARGVNGDQSSDVASSAGAVYVFARSGSSWSQQAYVKASNTDCQGLVSCNAYELFGHALALSGNGSTLAVSALYEGSLATGIDGNAFDDSAPRAGAVYVFTRVGASWAQQAYVKASNTDADDNFGTDVALSNDGNTLAVGAMNEASSASGVGGNQASNALNDSGAAYVFVRGGSAWSQQAYVKASNPGSMDEFGYAVSLSGSGDVLLIGARSEFSDGTSQSDDSAPLAGAAYVFTRAGTTWTQEAWLKATTVDDHDEFGFCVALSADGTTLAIGAPGEASAATGVGGDQTDDTAAAAGAVTVFRR